MFVVTAIIAGYKHNLCYAWLSLINWLGNMVAGSSLCICAFVHTFTAP